MMNKQKKGFTLVELLIVICLIGILASLILPRYFGQLEKSRASEALNIMGAISKGQEAYFTEHGAYASPSTSDEWLTLGIEDPNTRDGRYYQYLLFVDNGATPPSYCIVARRCYPDWGGGCVGTADTSFQGTGICLGSDGLYFGTNPAGPSGGTAGVPTSPCVNPSWC